MDKWSCELWSVELIVLMWDLGLRVLKLGKFQTDPDEAITWTCCPGRRAFHSMKAQCGYRSSYQASRTEPDTQHCFCPAPTRPHQCCRSSAYYYYYCYYYISDTSAKLPQRGHSYPNQQHSSKDAVL